MSKMNALTRVLGSIGSIVKRELVRELPKATSTLSRSIAYEVDDDGQIWELRVEAEDYFKYVEGGRRPGKMPPLKKISDWCIVVGITASAAYPIARKIAENGIKPKNILRNLIEQRETSFTSIIDTALTQDIEQELDDILTQFIQQK
jgi:hypothetical protein